MLKAIIRGVRRRSFASLQSELKAKRVAGDIDSFVAFFDVGSPKRRLAPLVYRELQRWSNVGDFPVAVDDGLYDVYGIADEDLDELVLRLAAWSGLPLPTTASVRGCRAVNTVGDLMELLSFLDSASK